MIEMNDPEGSYRRGYQQGAHDAIEAAIVATGDEIKLSKLREWVAITLARWRFQDRQGDRAARPPRAPS